MRRGIAIVCSSMLLSCFSAKAGNYRIEAEDCRNVNSWKVSFSKNASEGKLFSSNEKDNNVIEYVVDIPEKGTYAVWARSYGYGGGYRKYKVEINGVDSNCIFGDEPPVCAEGAFTCVKGGEFELPIGQTEIRLIPLSKYSRCDVIVLAGNESFTLPNDRKEIEKIPKLSPRLGKGNGQEAATARPVQRQDGGKMNILLFHGGRPWTATDTASILKTAGANVELVDSKLLAGLGGASIKTFVTDKVEPEPKDGITPVFEHLGNYSLVIVTAIKHEDQQKFFTEERIGKLKEYLEKGGTLILTESAPAVLGEILPVTFEGKQQAAPRDLYCKSRSDVFAGAPDKWPYFGENKKVTAKANSETLAEVFDASGESIGPYIASMNFGKGKIAYWNSDFLRQNQFRQLRDYAYTGFMLARLAENLTGIKLSAENVVYKRLPVPDVKDINSESLVIQPPSFQERISDFPAMKTQENDAYLWMQMGNGVTLEFDKTKLTISAYYPGIEWKVVNRMPLPDFLLSEGNDREWDKSTSEAVPVSSQKKANQRKLIVGDCRFAGWRLSEDGSIAVTVEGAGGKGVARRIVWKVKPMELTVFGEKYRGYGDAISLEGDDLTIASVAFKLPVRVGDSIRGHYARRMACYAAPRGYAEVPFSPETSTTTNRWGHFGTGQPFTWIGSPSGTYCEFIDTPAIVNSEISHEKNGETICVDNNLLLGKVKTPFTTPYIWHLVSENCQTGANPWMAMYQYLRMRYCGKVGIAPALSLPTSTHTNTCTPDELERSIKTAGKLNFKRHALPLCPSSLEKLASDECGKTYKMIEAAGMRPKPWSPGGYTQGMDNEVAGTHPEWLVYDKNGKVLQWFDCHPVFDLNNAGYLKHYFEVADMAVSLGLKDIYLDMGGAMAEVVNYQSPDPRPQLAGLMTVFKYFRDKGISVGVEGQNPLVLDNFWYRQKLYADHAGKEFAFTGMAMITNSPDNFSLDYFRLGMHGAFFQSDISGYACGMERIPGEIKLTEEVGRLNQMFNEALDVVGRPFVRQTAFGTYWTSEKGAAVFVWNPVKYLCLNLPEGWKIGKTLSLDGKAPDYKANIVENLSHKSVVLITKE